MAEDDGGGSRRVHVGVDDVESRAEFGALLEQLRQRSSLSLRELSTYVSANSGTPIGPSALGDWCRGERVPQKNRTTAFVCLLAKLGVDDPGPWLDALVRVRARGDTSDRAVASPYPGLRSFTSEESDRFFGRNELVAEAVARLRAFERDADGRRLLWVVGPSGVGKSSLLHAGLLPRLAADGHDCLTVTPGAEPTRRLARAVARHRGGDTVAADAFSNEPSALCAALAEGAGASERPTVLVVDQFEEVLRECDTSEAAAFFDLIDELTAPSPRPGPLVVLGLRIDFYGEVAERAGFVRSLQDAQLLVGPMDAAQLTEAIVEPARRAGASVDPSLVELLLRDVVPGGRRASGALPFLAHALRETWARSPSRRMTAEAYLQAGGVAGAIEESAERTYAELAAGEAVLARQVFLRLLHVSDDGLTTRRAVGTAELTGLGPAAGGPAEPGADALDVVDRFVDARLLIAGERTVEIAHESLLPAWPRLQGWADEDRDLLRAQRKVTEATRAWLESSRDPSMLATGARLEEMTELVGSPSPRLHLNRDELSFVEASAGQARAAEDGRRRQARRLRGLLGAAIASALLAVAFGVSANQARSEAVTARNEALSRQLATDARSLRDTDPTLAAQLAVVGYRVAPTTEALSALSESLDVPMAERHLNGEGAAVVATSADGRVVAVGDSADDAVRLYDGSDGRLDEVGSVRLARRDAEVYGVALTADGATLAVGDATGEVTLWDLSAPGGPQALGGPLDGPTGEFSEVALAPDGSELTAVGDEGVAHRWLLDDPARPRTASLGRAGRTTTSVAYAADGGTLAVGDDAGHVGLWRVGPAEAGAGAEPELGADLAGDVEVDGDGASVLDVAFSADGAKLATGTGAGAQAALWDVADPSAPRALPLADSTFESWVNTVTFSEDGTLLAAGSSDLDLRVWDVSTGEPVLHLPHPAHVIDATFLPGGAVLVSGAADGTVRAWDLARSAPVRVAGRAWNLALAEDGRRLAVFSNEETRVWRAFGSGPREPGEPVPTEGTASGAGDMTSDGAVVAVGTVEGPVDLVDVRRPDRPRPLGEPLGGSGQLVQVVAFSADDRLLAAAGNDSVVRVWDVGDPGAPVLVAQLDEPGEPVYTLAWSPTRRLLAVAGVDQEVQLYDFDDPGAGHHLATVPRPGGEAYGAAFDPGGGLLAVGDVDGRVVLWDVTSPERPREVETSLTGSDGQVVQLAFDPTGDRLAAATVDGTTWVWDIADRRRPEVDMVLGAGSAAYGVAYRPADGSLLTSGADGVVHVWPTDPEAAIDVVCARAGDDLTAEEWADHIEDVAYDPPCGRSG